MNLKPWHTWAVVVLSVIMTVGCSAAAAPAVEESGPAPAWEAVGADGPVEALEARVEELEARLEALRWTEADAIAVVQYRVWARVWDCDAHSRHEDARGCYPRQDSILQVTPEGFLGPYLVKVMLQQGEWSAKYEPGSDRWRIEASAQDMQPLVFHAYEKTGLVVGVVPNTP